MSIKLGAALGFAMKAGKVKSGDFTAEKLVKSGAANLVILDNECSCSTQKKWQNSCTHYLVRLIMCDAPGVSMGKPDNKIFVVTDEGFRDMILKAYDAQIEHDPKNSDN